MQDGNKERGEALGSFGGMLEKLAAEKVKSGWW